MIRNSVHGVKNKLASFIPRNSRYAGLDIRSMGMKPSKARQATDNTPLVEAFFAPKTHLVHKWIHYFPIYERLLSGYRGKKFSMLEIGVSKGGSLDMWRQYFGDRAEIYGIDIDPECANRVNAPNQVRIGSQADPAFLDSVVKEMSGLDVVLDDGSHVAEHQRASFRHLFPLLPENGLYIIEDTHTAYWADYGGGLNRPGTAIEFAKSLVDDMHTWYHPYADSSGFGGEIASVQFYDSIIVFEKRSAKRPAHVRIPGEKQA